MAKILGCFSQPTTQKTLWCQNTLYYYPYQTTHSPLIVHNTGNGIHFSTSRSLKLSQFLSVLQHQPARESHYWDFRDSQLQANFSLLTNPTTISINFLCNCINMHENIVHKVTVLPLFHQFWYQQEMMAKIPSKLKLQTLYLHAKKPPRYLHEYPTFPPFNPPRLG